MPKKARTVQLSLNLRQIAAVFHAISFYTAGESGPTTECCSISADILGNEVHNKLWEAMNKKGIADEDIPDLREEEERTWKDDEDEEEDY